MLINYNFSLTLVGRSSGSILCSVTNLTLCLSKLESAPRMDAQLNTPAYHAILIGIDAYPLRPLRGAVRDVRRIEEYLRDTLPEMSIAKFTASNGSSAESIVPIEDPQLLPTHENIRSAFDRVINQASGGDFVYIHFSGHGTRETPNYHSYNQSSGDLALVVLTGNNEDPVTYLWGLNLAYSVLDMVKKDLVVTLVLDCCFSGSVYRRGEPRIRFLPFDSLIAARAPSDYGDCDVEIIAPRNRDTSMLPNWLVDPSKYAVLVACGPHDFSPEIEVDGRVHGLLSYFLLQTLKDGGGLRQSLKDVYGCLRAGLRISERRRYPILYGNKEQGFFGHPSSAMTAGGIPLSRKADGIFEMPIGRAHGVSQGDGFAIKSLGHTVCTSQAVVAVGKATSVTAFTSDLSLQIIPPFMHSTGRWQAISISQLTFQKFPIKLASDLPGRDDWVMELECQSLHVLKDAPEGLYSLEVTLNERQEYEVRLDAGRKRANLPLMPVIETSIHQMCSVLKHLALFHLVEDLGKDTPTSIFRDCFRIRMHRDGACFGPDSPIEAENGSKLELVIENQGVTKLYVAIFNLGPEWQVNNITRATYEEILASQGLFRTFLSVSIPETMKQEGHRSCNDIIKVFVTSHPISFDYLELPKLGEAVKPKQAKRLGSTPDGIAEHFVAVNFYLRIVLPGAPD